MSEITNVKTDTPVKAKKVKTSKTYTVSQLAVERAKVRGIDTSRAAKEIRSRLRANFAHVCQLDPSVLKAKDAANDGNRWPAMNADVRTFVLKTNGQRAADAANG